MNRNSRKSTMRKQKSKSGSTCSIKADFYKNRTSRICNVLWPVATHTMVATGKIAQLRRSVVIQSLRWVDTVGLLHIRGAQFFSQPITIAHALQMGLILFATTLTVTLSPLYHWPLFMVVFVLSIVIILFIMQLLFEKERQQVHKHIARQIEYKYREKPAEARQSVVPQSMLQRVLFPDTPMPATPLIRILETIDLSSSSIEHFIDIADQSPAEVPLQDPAPHAKQSDKL